MSARLLMVQGTTSDAGKSALCIGLCRLFARHGVDVAPFKPQNMALNSAVGVDGGELGRAQAEQARACGLPPHSDMNPVLLKPNSDQGAQVIIRGHAIGEMQAVAYHDYKRIAREAVLDACATLRARHALLVVEGAGSPAEINLRAGDIANMGFAEAVDAPVLLIADIDRGGVFAHLVGTLALLTPSEQARVKGFVINRFRGDLSLLRPGLDWLERETGRPVFGVLPYLHGLGLAAEDAIATAAPAHQAAERLRVVVPVLPRISNHTDFDPLRAHPQVQFTYVGPGATPPAADLVILPGSKSVRADLAWLRDQGWEPYLQRHLRYGGKVLGICGGLQMLGTVLHDPDGLEGPAGSAAGLGLFDYATTLAPGKVLKNRHATLSLEAAPVIGYEIHAGRTRGPALDTPFARLEDGSSEGALSADGQLAATYLHGLFDTPQATTALLRWAGLVEPEGYDHHAYLDGQIERMADACATHLDLERLATAFDLPSTFVPPSSHPRGHSD